MKKINQHIDIVAGIFWFIAAVIGYVLSMGIVQRASTEGSVGPAFFPKLTCLLIMAVCAIIIIMGVNSVKRGVAETGCFPEEKRDLITVAATIVLCIIYSASLVQLGFILSSILFLVIVISLFDLDWKKHLVRTVLISILVSIITYLIFRYVFSLMLPAGRIF